MYLIYFREKKYFFTFWHDFRTISLKKKLLGLKTKKSVQIKIPVLQKINTRKKQPEICKNSNKYDLDLSFPPLS